MLIPFYGCCCWLAGTGGAGNEMETECFRTPSVVVAAAAFAVASADALGDGGGGGGGIWRHS